MILYCKPKPELGTLLVISGKSVLLFNEFVNFPKFCKNVIAVALISNISILDSPPTVAFLFLKKKYKQEKYIPQILLLEISHHQSPYPQGDNTVNVTNAMAFLTKNYSVRKLRFIPANYHHGMLIKF